MRRTAEKRPCGNRKIMKNVLILNDISGLGNCSMSANLPIFTKLNHYCMPVPTATFSCQTGFEKYTFLRNEKLSQCVADVLANRDADAIYVGFCVDEPLLDEAADVAIALRAQGKFVFVDPILGDNGALYGIFDTAYAKKMKRLVSLSHCISPNLTEACLLADVDFGELQKQVESPTFLAFCGNVFQNFLQKTGAENAVITGIPCGNLIGNLVLEKDCPVRFVTNQRVQTNYSGTGDAFSSVLCGELLNGCSLLKATEIAANFVSKAAECTRETDRRFGVEFFRVMDLL